MLATASLLAQLRPSGTAAVPAYVAPIVTEITKIFICNTSGSPASFSLYHDDNAAIYDQNTALYFAEVINANATKLVEMQGAGAGISILETGVLAVQSSVADALTFSIYGVTSSITGVR